MSTACSVSNEWLYILTINLVLMSQRERITYKNSFSTTCANFDQTLKKNFDPPLRTDFSGLMCGWNRKLNSEVSKQTFWGWTNSSISKNTVAPPASTSLNCAREKVGVNEQSLYWFSLAIQWQRWCIGDIVKYLGVLCNALVNLVPFAGRYQESLGYRFYWIRVMKILEAGLLMTSLFLGKARTWSVPSHRQTTKLQ